MPAVLRACAPVCGIDIVGATHGSPAPAVLGCLDVGRRMRRPYGAWNSGQDGPRKLSALDAFWTRIREPEVIAQIRADEAHFLVSERTELFQEEVHESR